MDWWKAQRAQEANAGNRNCFYVYDERMLLHTDYADHPECPMRISSIHDHLQKVGLLDQMTKLEIVESEVKVQEDGTSTYPAIAAVHAEEDIRKTETMSDKLGD